MAKRSFAVLLVAMLTMAIAFTGCKSSGAATSSGDNSQTAQKVKITFWDQNAGSTTTPGYTELINKFNSSQSAVEVEYVGIPSSQALQKYSTAIAADATPDVGGMQPEYISSFSARKALEPLDKYFDKWSDKDQMLSTEISDIRNLTTDKKLYMLSNTSNFSCIWYRPDEFKAAGLTFPTTWDDFFTDIQKLTDKTNGKYGYTIRGGSGSGLALEMMMYGYSGITDFFDKNGKCTINDPKNVEFATKYLGMYKKYTPESDLTASFKEMTASFDSGSVSMFYHNLGSYVNHKSAFKDDSKFAAAPLPVSIKGYRVIAGAQTTGYSIFSQSKNKDAAWKFVAYLCSADSISYWNQQVVGQMPTTKNVLSMDWVKSSQSISMAAKTVEDKNTKTLLLPYYLPDYSTTLSKTVEPGIQAVMAGTEPVTKLLNDWANAMTQAKQDYDKSHQGTASSSASSKG